ncbi:MAG: hypothetical protein WC758_01555 [Candidatus Woesearchaeota archaeon]
MVKVKKHSSLDEEVIECLTHEISDINTALQNAHDLVMVKFIPYLRFAFGKENKSVDIVHVYEDGYLLKRQKNDVDEFLLMKNGDRFVYVLSKRGNDKIDEYVESTVGVSFKSVLTITEACTNLMNKFSDKSLKINFVLPYNIRASHIPEYVIVDTFTDGIALKGLNNKNELISFKPDKSYLLHEISF